MILNLGAFYGTLPSSIGDMPSLQFLNLFNTGNSGTIPDSFSALSDTLTHLTLGKLSMTGTIPSWLQDFKLLTVLALFDASFTGTIPIEISQISDLEFVSFGECSYTGTVPSEIYDMTALKIFFARGNQITGTLPDSLGDMTALELFFFSECSLTGTVPSSINNLSRLGNFEVNDNQITGQLPVVLDGMLSLSVFNLADNAITGGIPVSMGRMPRLAYLNFRNTSMDDDIPVSLCDASQLYSLRIDKMNVCYPGCLGAAIGLGSADRDLVRCQEAEDIALCALVKDITFPFDAIDSRTPEVYESAHPFSSAFTINEDYFTEKATKYTLTFDAFTDRGFATSLSFFSCIVTANGVSSPCSANGLLSDVSITIESDTGFNLFLYSERCYVGSCWGYRYTVESTIPLQGWSCTPPPLIARNETLLDIVGYKNESEVNSSYAGDYCAWTGIDCAESNGNGGTWGSIDSISLAAYNLKGALPSDVGYLTSLRSIKLSANSFSGELPKSFSQLSNLNVLDVSYNDFIGEIGVPVGGLSKIRQLNLAVNSFTGTIPAVLTTLRALTFLQLSANGFTGVLNSELCGFPNSSIMDFGVLPDVTCYDACWTELVKSPTVDVGLLEACAPSGMPTSMPTEGQPKGFNYVYLIPIIMAGSIVLVLCMFSRAFILRRTALSKLPVHRALLSKKLQKPSRNAVQQMNILNLIHRFPETLMKLDYDGRTALDILLQQDHLVDTYSICKEMVKAGFRASCEFSQDIGNRMSVESMGVMQPMKKENVTNVWVELVQNDDNLDLVTKVLDDCETIMMYLVACYDAHGRGVVNIASPLCQKVLSQCRFFYKRYDIKTMGHPHHLSPTSMLHIAYDTATEKNVALKFIREKRAYIKEIATREKGRVNPTYVIDVMERYDGDKDEKYWRETRRHGWDDYPYCIVMPAADRNLAEILAREQVAGQDMRQIKSMCVDMVHALGSLHEAGWIHGDLKPLNVMRIHGSLMLIDLDAAAHIGTGYSGAKYSSAYIPPELIYAGENMEDVQVKTFERDDDEHEPESDCKETVDGIVSHPYDLVPASPAHDIWSLGAVLYQLCTGKSLFFSDSADNIEEADMLVLMEFTDEFKSDRLSRVSDLLARNLIAQMLMKDPRRRPGVSQILSHPFLSGQHAPRMVGQEPEYDVFISYRVSSDSDLAEAIYKRLTANGLKVWWDQECLQPGTSWKIGFCDGLSKSRIFMPLLSREAINSERNSRANYTLLTADSPCDNVLLEQQLALELFTRGLIEHIYPVMIGDKGTRSEDVVYSNYFADKCDPRLVGDVIVKSNKAELSQHLDRLCLGTPLLDGLTVRKTKEALLVNQGRLIVNTLECSLDRIDLDMRKMSNAASKDSVRGVGNLRSVSLKSISLRDVRFSNVNAGGENETSEDEESNEETKM
jgi:serine/threonine protein kinase/Leucine-rich repeat (LRR) protein